MAYFDIFLFPTLCWCPDLTFKCPELTLGKTWQPKGWDLLWLARQVEKTAAQAQTPYGPLPIFGLCMVNLQQGCVKLQ